MLALVVAALLNQADPTPPPIIEAPPDEQLFPEHQVTPEPQQVPSPPPVSEQEREPVPVTQHFAGPTIGPTTSLYGGWTPFDGARGGSKPYGGFRFGARLWPDAEHATAVSFQLGMEAHGDLGLSAQARLELAPKEGPQYVVPYFRTGLVGGVFTLLPASPGAPRETGFRLGLSLGWCVWALQNNGPKAGDWSGWNWSSGSGDGALIVLAVILLATTPEFQLVYEHGDNGPLGRRDEGRLEIGIGF